MTELTDFRRSKDEYMGHEHDSPLTHEQLESFSGLVSFRTMIFKCSPSRVAIIASPIAVFPEDASTTVPPLSSLPHAIACSMKWRAMRSLVLPIGLRNSSLA